MNPFTNLEELDYIEPIPGLKAKMIHTETQTYAFWEIDKGTLLPSHHHPHEQVSFVTAGTLELTIEGETRLIKKGMFVNIPSNAVHKARAITQVELTDVFTPIREDFKKLTDKL